MKIRSLRLRLLIAASCAIMLALAIAGVGLVWLFERHVERRVGAELDTYLNQLAARTTFGTDGLARLSGRLADPRFEQVYSGLYWQITDEQAARDIRSRSLWDTRLGLPRDMPAVGDMHVHGIAGPRDTRLLVHERRLLFDSGQGERLLRLAVAVDRADLAALSADFAEDIAVFLLLLAAVLILAAWLQVNVGLKPLATIRRAVGAVREGGARRLDIAGPSEIKPLVDEVNSLLDAQDRAMRRARDRAADLAHGFKTPLTALLGDAKRLRSKGEGEIAGEIERTATLLRGHIERELLRARLRNTGAAQPVDVTPVIQGLISTLKRTPDGESIGFSVEMEPGLSVRANTDDLSDILGNLLENAVRHASARVALKARRQDRQVRFEIEDDGPGLGDAQSKALMERGARLDTSGPGAGLGLAITSELLAHYGQHLSLTRSVLGGLKASFALPG